MTDESHEIRIDAPRAVAWLVAAYLAVSLVFLVLDYQVGFGSPDAPTSLRRLFNMAREDSLGAWIGIVELVLAAVTAWGLAAVISARGGSRTRVAGWIVIATMLTYLALDDGAVVHERVGSLFRRIQETDGTSLGARALRAFPSYSWQVVYGPILAALGAFTAMFSWRELAERRLRAWALLGLGCWAAAVGLDFVEGLDAHHRWNVLTAIAGRLDHGRLAASRFAAPPIEVVVHFARAIEETIENVGTTLLWGAFLTHLAHTADGVKLRLTDSRSTAAV